MIDPVSEVTFAASQHNRKDHEPIFVDEVKLHQRVNKAAAAENQDVLAGMLLQLGYFVRIAAVLCR